MNHYNLSLLTDLYQLTMAYGYWKKGWTEKEAVFNLFFRKNPFKGHYAIACGLQDVCQFIESFKLNEPDINYLASLNGNDGKPLFETAFLDYLQNLELNIDIDAVPEGTLVFPNEPLIRIKGPLLQCQILESVLLNLINFPTLIATKGSRIVLAAKGKDVLEFGLRRAQGIDGALTASRAAYIGGCSATSNVLAGHLFGIPVKGTHAHSWVMSHNTEEQAFDDYANTLPNNCIFLVDTYDTIEGVMNAVKTGKELRRKGFEMVGIRLDSGDLAELSKAARKILDSAGFPDAKIVASNDLDEYRIEALNEQGARIDIWGVGTRLVTAYDQASLGGVYKLSAIKENEKWLYKLKLSEQAIKTSNPGIQQIRRYSVNGVPKKDVLYDELIGIDDEDGIDLLVPVFRKGQLVYKLPPINKIREKSLAEVRLFITNLKSKLNGSFQYPVILESRLSALKEKLILEHSSKALYSKH